MSSTRDVALSTGQRVQLPLQSRLSAFAGAFPAPIDRLATALPSGLSPFRLTPRRGVVVLAGVDYEAVGSLSPYDEFAVLVPAVRGPPVNLPLLGGLWHLGGYVHWLPVTADAGRALGREVWGYPKLVADVEIDRVGGRHRATVSVDGDRAVTLWVAPARTFSWSGTAYSYSVDRGDLLRTRVDADGEIAVRPRLPGGPRAWYDLGDGPAADPLRELGLGGQGQAIARLVAPRLRVSLYEGEPVE